MASARGRASCACRSARRPILGARSSQPFARVAIGCDRCQMRGGLSAGPRTAEGRQRCAEADRRSASERWTAVMVDDGDGALPESAVAPGGKERVYITTALLVPASSLRGGRATPIAVGTSESSPCRSKEGCGPDLRGCAQLVDVPTRVELYVTSRLAERSSPGDITCRGLLAVLVRCAGPTASFMQEGVCEGQEPWLRLGGTNRRAARVRVGSVLNRAASSASNDRCPAACCRGVRQPDWFSRRARRGRQQRRRWEWRRLGVE